MTSSAYRSGRQSWNFERRYPGRRREPDSHLEVAQQLRRAPYRLPKRNTTSSLSLGEVPTVEPSTNDNAHHPPSLSHPLREFRARTR